MWLDCGLGAAFLLVFAVINYFFIRVGLLLRSWFIAFFIAEYVLLLLYAIFTVVDTERVLVITMGFEKVRLTEKVPVLVTAHLLRLAQVL